MFAYARRWGARLSAILLTVGVVSFPTVWLVIATCTRGGEYDKLRRAHWCPDHSDLFLNVVELSRQSGPLPRIAPQPSCKHCVTVTQKQYLTSRRGACRLGKAHRIRNDEQRQ